MQIGLVAPLIGDQLQVTVPLSEEISLHGEARKKVLWLEVVLRHNLGLLHIEFVRQYGSRDYIKISVSISMKIYCDNKAAISITPNSFLHDRTKHIEVDKHFIKKKMESGLICVPFVPSAQQVANILTKGLHKGQFELLVNKLAMEDIYKLA